MHNVLDNKIQLLIFPYNVYIKISGSVLSTEGGGELGEKERGAVLCSSWAPQVPPASPVIRHETAALLSGFLSIEASLSVFPDGKRCCHKISGKLKQQSRAGGSNRAIRPKLLTPFWLTLMSFQVSRGQNMLSPKCQYHLQWSLLLPSQSTQLIFLNRDHLDDYPGIHQFILHQRTPFHIPEINMYAYCLLSKPSTICHLSFCFS